MEIARILQNVTVIYFSWFQSTWFCCQLLFYGWFFCLLVLFVLVWFEGVVWLVWGCFFSFFPFFGFGVFLDGSSLSPRLCCALNYFFIFPELCKAYSWSYCWATTEGFWKYSPVDHCCISGKMVTMQFLPSCLHVCHWFAVW